ncbi:MAG: PDZ domain-containing protein [Planctomycetota bacterium]
MRSGTICSSLLFAFGGVLFAIVNLPAQPAVEANPAVAELQGSELVRQLGDASLAVREAAYQKLLRGGRAMLPAVREGARSQDPEVRARAEELLKTLTQPRRHRVAKRAPGGYGLDLPSENSRESAVDADFADRIAALQQRSARSHERLRRTLLQFPGVASRPQESRRDEAQRPEAQRHARWVEQRMLLQQRRARAAAERASVVAQQTEFGVVFAPLSAALRSHLRLPTGGVQIAEVVANSAAAKAGLQAFDVITQVGEQEIDSVAELWEALHRSEPNQDLEVKLLRGGATSSLVLQALPKRLQSENPRSERKPRKKKQRYW